MQLNACKWQLCPCMIFFYSYCAAAKTNRQQRDRAGDYFKDPFVCQLELEKVTLLAWIEQGMHWGMCRDSLNDHKLQEWRLIQGWIMVLWKGEGTVRFTQMTAVRCIYVQSHRQYSTAYIPSAPLTLHTYISPIREHICSYAFRLSACWKWWIIELVIMQGKTEGQACKYVL